MQLGRLCVLGGVLLLAAATVSALVTPGEQFPTIKAGVAVTTNITTYTASSQYVKVCACSTSLHSKAYQPW
jgi:hypothetical protein